VSKASHKRLVFIHGEIKTPPFSEAARRQVGYHLRDVQRGRSLTMPISRPMPSIGRNVHELRVGDGDVAWRVIYHVGEHSIRVIDVFMKKTPKTPREVINQCKKRLAENPE